MSAKIIPFLARMPLNFAEFPDGYDAGIIANALLEARSNPDISDIERKDIEAVLDRIFNIEQNQCIEWRYAFQCYFQGNGRRVHPFRSCN